jgi:glycosyltransferase involved in cell wall biosynthesis
MRVLHVVNYGWPHVDGYTIRSAALVTAQAREMGWAPLVSTSPWPVFAAGRDEDFTTERWGPRHQVAACDGAAHGWERPALGLAPVTAARYRAGLARLMGTTDPALVHAHHPHQSAAPALAAARARGLPFIYELRCFNGDYDLDSGSAYARARGARVNALELSLARRADAVVTIADGLAERLAAGGVPEGRIHVVRNAVDTAAFAPRPPRASDGIVRMGYATTFARMENLDGFLRAIRLVLDRRPEARDRLRVVLAGQGAEYPAIEALRAELELTGIVDLPGFVPYSRMPDLLASLDLFVVTRGDHAVSRRTTPLKPLEALAVGRPVLSTDLPAMRELMGGRPDVRFADPAPEGLAGGIEAFLDAPWAGTGEIGDRAWSSEVRRYVAIYEAAARAAPTARARDAA